MRVHRSDGFSLIELMVAAGAMSLLAVGVGLMFSNLMHGQMRVLQNAEINDLNTALQMTFASPANCACQFTGLTFNGSSSSATGPNQILSSCQAGAPPIVTTGQILPGEPSGLFVTSIQIANIFPTQNPGEYIGTLKVNFDPTKTIGSLPIAKTSLVMETTGPTGALTITGCQGSSTMNQQGLCVAFGGTWTAATQSCSLNNGAGLVPCAGAPVPPNGSQIIPPVNPGSMGPGGSPTCGGGVVDGTCNQCATPDGAWLCTATGWACYMRMPGTY